MSDVVEDPYTPGQVPRVLAGRSEELARIRDRLARVSTFGELGGPLLVFHAPRGLGKTSLLREGERQARASGFVTAWAACTRGRPFLPEIVHSVHRALHRSETPVPARERKRWGARLEKLSLGLGVAGVSVGGEVAFDREPGSDAVGAGDRHAPIGALEDLLHDTATLVRRFGAGLLVMVDELHAAPADELAVLMNALQNLDGERDGNPLAVVAAGLPVTPEAITRAATFGERSTFVPLDRLSDRDARDVLTGPAEALGVGWTRPALDLVVGECRGHPYLLQLLGSATWRAASPSAGTRLGSDAVRRGVPAARDQLDAMFRARWGSATPGEQAFLRSMAEAERGSDGGAEGGNVGRAAIAAGLGRDSRSIGVPRERLIEKGVIEPVGHGLVRFTMPGFGAYVRERAPQG